MTHLYDNPDAFAKDMLEGFLDLYRDSVVAVKGGVVRATETDPRKVAVVVGGGSGHYPAFCGLVGTGLADGAVVGNIFTSPSAEDAYSVCKSASGGSGVLLCAGNYAGDVINFTQAQDHLQAGGIDTRVVFVTDDLASGSRTELERRRGIAGDFVIFKIAGAAAEQGYDLEKVERAARRANACTRTLGVAFAGCTMPGADHPLFTVPSGKMGVGLGIHGEPGISDEDLPRAAQLARRLVDGVLDELPREPSRRVGAILNGLGATKYEELFVVWRTVSTLLTDRGYTVVEPECGEIVTSLDMAGCSLTLVALDEEMERLWCAAADTPAFRKGPTQAVHFGTLERRAARVSDGLGETATCRASASPASRKCAAHIVAALEAVSVALASAEDELGRIDAIAGDGDHGRGMVKGVTSAVSAARGAMDRNEGASSVLQAGGRAWAAQAGGTSGALWGAALVAVGDRLGDQADVFRGSDVVGALRAGLTAVQHLGGASLGDKTMIDALAPFIDTFQHALEVGKALPGAWQQAALVAEDAARATAQLRPRVGRARPLAERSLGSPDAGATSLALIMQVVGEVLAGEMPSGLGIR